MSQAYFGSLSQHSHGDLSTASFLINNSLPLAEDSPTVRTCENPKLHKTKYVWLLLNPISARVGWRPISLLARANQSPKTPPSFSGFWVYWDSGTGGLGLGLDKIFNKYEFCIEALSRHVT